MRALRDWLQIQGWFLLEVDPTPTYWRIIAVSPTGTVMSFSGTEKDVDGWGTMPREIPVI